MSYFRELPNISYVSRLPGANRSDERIEVKNIFKRAKIRSDIESAITAFKFGTIPEGARPDVVAKNVYDDPELDWVVLITNNITSIRDQWPLSHNDLESYLLDKYGSTENIYAVHHYETFEIRDEYNRTILEGGLEVDSDFQFTYSAFDGTIKTVNPVGPVTNYEYETSLNEAKRIIKILKPEYLSAFVSDMRNMMRHQTSSQYVSRTMKRSYNPKDSGV